MHWNVNEVFGHEYHTMHTHATSHVNPG